MLGRSNLFSNILCPFYQNGQCNRPYCHFKHAAPTQLIPDEPAAIQEYIPSYSTTPSLNFQGYQGFFQGTNDYADQTPSFSENFVVEQLPTNRSRFVDQVDVPSYSSTTSSAAVVVPSAQESTNINELAKNLAAINNAIRELQDKLTAHKSQFGDLTDSQYDPEEAIVETDDVSQLINNNHARSKSSNFKSYRPTPIEELKKMNGSKKRSHSSSSASGVNGTHSKNGRFTTKKLTVPEPDCELGALVDDLVGSNVDDGSPEKVHSGRKAKTKKRKSVSTFDLFGNNSSTEEDDDIKAVEPKRDESYPKKIKTERKSVSFKISPDREQSPPMKKPKIEISVVKSDQMRKVQQEVVVPSPAPKRLAHANVDGKNVAVLRQAGGERSRPSANYLTPKEQLRMRFAQMQKQKEELLKQKPKPTSKHNLSTSSGDDRHVPTDNTVAGTVRKGEKRVAHVPLRSTLKRPVIDVDIGSKVPTVVRQRYLNLFIDECMKFAKSEEGAFKLALEQEKTVFNKSASKAAYLNSVVNAIKRLRDDKGLKSAFDGFADGQATSSSSGTSQLVSHASSLGGRQAAKCSFTLKKLGEHSVELKGQDLYDKLLEFVLITAQLEENGYPRCDPQVPKRAVYKKDSTVKLYIDDENTKRSCCRCGIMFQISADGDVSNGDCVYHWGRPWKKKVNGFVESRYNCCQGDFNSKGCCVAKTHVTETMPKSSLDNYYQTQTSYGFESSVFSLDCEMVYTTGGTELARVTIVDEDLNVVYERIVKPQYKVLDYNTRFSGLTEKDVLTSNVTLANVQTDLSKLFCAETILMGHSLESDLRALRIIHDRVVDTSVVFPHRLGGTFKRALRTLMLEYLQKIIQDDIDGHDSKEDACACMQLMKWKIKDSKK